MSEPDIVERIKSLYYAHVDACDKIERLRAELARLRLTDAGSVNLTETERLATTGATMTQGNEEPSAASAGSAITARELFESLTRRQQLLLLKAIGTAPRWAVCGNAIQRVAAAPVVFVRAYQSHRRDGMRADEAAYWAWKWTRAFCL